MHLRRRYLESHKSVYREGSNVSQDGTRIMHMGKPSHGLTIRRETTLIFTLDISDRLRHPKWQSGSREYMACHGQSNPASGLDTNKPPALVPINGSTY